MQPGGLWFTPPHVSGHGDHVSEQQLYGRPWTRRMPPQQDALSPLTWSPLTILHEPSAGDNRAHTKVVALSVSLEGGNFRGNCDGLVVTTQPQGLSLYRLLACNSFMNLAVSVSYIYTKPCAQWSGRCGHNLLFSHGLKFIHIFYVCHVIITFPSSPALGQADDKMVKVMGYAVHISVMRVLFPENVMQSYIFHKQFTRGR